jgi:hypothetical protein
MVVQLHSGSVVQWFSCMVVQLQGFSCLGFSYNGTNMSPCSTLLSLFETCTTSDTSVSQSSINEDSLCQSSDSMHTEQDEQGPDINGCSKVSSIFAFYYPM